MTRVLVFGVTGNQGHAVVDALLGSGKGYQVRGFTRDPNSTKAKALIQKGVELVKGDVSDEKAMETALADVDYVFVAPIAQFGTPTLEEGLQSQIDFAGKVAKAISTNGRIQFAVVTTGVLLGSKSWEKYRQAETSITEAVKGNAVVFRPGWFFSNLPAMIIPAIQQYGALSVPFDAKRKLPYIDPQDIGRFAAAAFDSPDDFRGKEQAIACHELSHEEVARSIGDFLGKEVPFVEMPREQAAAAMGPSMADFYKMIEDNWEDVTSHYPDYDRCNKMLPNMTTLEQYLKKNCQA
eukprot:GFYU01004662.1.p1 GENE.GFYU01004662.1~~GFYU01004662.1.p1  ORF type:complete len:294 (-),score=46.76 GFYU01004662.1:255-1136(-)